MRLSPGFADRVDVVPEAEIRSVFPETIPAQRGAFRASAGKKAIFARKPATYSWLHPSGKNYVFITDQPIDRIGQNWPDKTGPIKLD
jgi:hypothetical protein